MMLSKVTLKPTKYQWFCPRWLQMCSDYHFAAIVICHKKRWRCFATSSFSGGEAKFEQSLELKYVFWLQRGFKFNNIALLFYVWISMEFIKSQGDLPKTWMVGNRQKPNWSRVCFRRRQNGVHHTTVNISSNEQKLLIWLQPWQNAAWCERQN